MHQKIIDCLKIDMKISWEHFEEKIGEFSKAEQHVINIVLEKFYDESCLVKAKISTEADFNKLFYEDGSSELNEFLQAMFDCFKVWQFRKGIELSKALYEHTNRGVDNWFPIVIIDEKVNEFVTDSNYVTVYRGCNLTEYETKQFKLRQSWSSDFEIAKLFAFHYSSGKVSLEDRVVIKAKVKKEDILWGKVYESECVLAINFSPLSYSIEMTFDDFKSIPEI